MPWFEYPAVAAVGNIDRRGHAGEFDVILISGDAYVDHPAFAAAVIARSLEAMGLSVAVIAQPDWRSDADFRVFGRPRLFFGVTAGAMDSMVANYTAMKLPRREDRLSPGGQSGLRPKRAATVYTQILRKAFPDSCIVLGGVEASLRRFAHYDFWEDRIRDPILIDAPADLLVYGMGEAPLRDIVSTCQASPDARPNFAERRMAQTCIRVPKGQGAEVIGGLSCRVLPTSEQCRSDPRAFLEMSRFLDNAVRPGGPVLLQQHPKGDVICFPPSAQNWLAEPSLMNGLRFNRRVHPMYTVPVPGLEPVQFSIQTHRGCAGTCTFCALSIHQGRQIRSRKPEDLVAEARTFLTHPDFRGTIPDLGGPSVNMYGWDCRVGGCEAGLCTHPQRCGNLRGTLKPLAELLTQVASVPGIRHVFLGSGLRYDLLRENDWDDLGKILRHHVSGQLKVAPEHVDRTVLALMRKGMNASFPDFVDRFRSKVEQMGMKAFLVPYFMTAFPGSVGRDAVLRDLVSQLHVVHEQMQEFTPTPGSLATAMFSTGLDLNGKPIEVPRTDTERRSGRKTLQQNPNPIVGPTRPDRLRSPATSRRKSFSPEKRRGRA